MVDLGKMLHRLIDENVKMSIITAPDAGLVKVEHGQIEQLLVNLVVNARDAMPDGGELMVTTRAVWNDGKNQDHFSELPEGHYVELSVSDTGSGMDEEVTAPMATPRRALTPIRLAMEYITIGSLQRQLGGRRVCLVV